MRLPYPHAPLHQHALITTSHHHTLNPVSFPPVANVPALLEQAKDLGVDSSFVDRVEDVYQTVAPKLEARNNLRVAVEVVHHDSIVDCLAQVKEMSGNNEFGPFGQQEIQAAEQMLKMVSLKLLHLPHRAHRAHRAHSTHRAQTALSARFRGGAL